MSWIDKCVILIQMITMHGVIRDFFFFLLMYTVFHLNWNNFYLL